MSATDKRLFGVNEVKHMRRMKWVVFGLVLVGFAGCVVLLPCMVKVRDGAAWIESASQLKTIGQAIRNYHEAYGKLPPAVVYDKEGRPLHSWRVLLLPFLEGQSLYSQIHLDEPWDSPHNKPLLEQEPQCYRVVFGGRDAVGLTHYRVFVGSGTAFERDGLTWDDFPDGPKNTILVVEAHEAVPWTKPADLSYEPDKPLPALGGLYSKPYHFLCYEVGRTPGFNACFADGTIRFLSAKTDEKTIRSLITRNSGEKVDVSRLAVP